MEEANRPGRNEMEDGSLEDGEVEDRDLLKQNLQTSAGLRACSFLTVSCTVSDVDADDRKPL